MTSPTPYEFGQLLKCVQELTEVVDVLQAHVQAMNHRMDPKVPDVVKTVGQVLEELARDIDH